MDSSPVSRAIIQRENKEAIEKEIDASKKEAPLFSLKALKMRFRILPGGTLERTCY
jgi:hypothetical protein